MKLLRTSITPLICAVLLLLAMPVFAAEESSPPTAALTSDAPVDATTTADTAAPAAPAAAPAEAAAVAPADAGPAPGSTASMLDAVFIIVGLGFLAGTVLYVYACDRA